jgi:hypothetical protein
MYLAVTRLPAFIGVTLGPFDEEEPATVELMRDPDGQASLLGAVLLGWVEAGGVGAGAASALVRIASRICRISRRHEIT